MTEKKALLGKALGISKKEIKLGGHRVNLHPLKLKHLAEFEEKFGRDRLMIAGAAQDKDNPNSVMPTMAEMCYLLWAMVSQDEECPWHSLSEMTEAVDSRDLIDNYDWILSFFLGVDVSGTLSSSSSSDSESAPETGQTSTITK